MNKIVPTRLKQGDEVRVIAPSRSLCMLSEESIEIAKKSLEDLGLKVTFGKNVYNSINDEYKCGSIEDRIEDLHEAFKDENVKAILTVIGGYNVNQLLDYIDYELIKNNPKIICGYSDITALLNAIYAKTGLVTYYGPHFSTFGIKYGKEYIEKYFKKIFFEDEEIIVEPSIKWSNDEWYLNQEKRNFIENEGMKVINEGKCTGNIIGGNLCTLNLLQGTKYMPGAQNCILFIEDDGLVGKEFTKEFDRNIQSLIHSIGTDNIKGIVVGRAETNCEMNLEKWKMIFDTKKELKDIPIIIDADFGHTTPMFTFPIGGYSKIDTNDNSIIISNK